MLDSLFSFFSPQTHFLKQYPKKRLPNFLLLDSLTLSVLPTFDWATEIAMCEDVAIVSGFHSKMEREVLNYLLRRRCGIICVLARSIYQQISAKYREAYNQIRVLFITVIDSPNTTTVSKDRAVKRNQLVASLADELVFSSITSISSLFSIYKTSSKSK